MAVDETTKKDILCFIIGFLDFFLVEISNCFFSSIKKKHIKTYNSQDCCT